MSDKIDNSLDTKASGKTAEADTAKSALGSEFIASMSGKASAASKEISPPPNIPIPRPEPWPNPWPNPWPQDPCAPDGIPWPKPGCPDPNKGKDKDHEDDKHKDKKKEKGKEKH